eukprot:m.166528 g.166528  ORF g.166528 m.166528 type:complete len:436 (+) comp15281_c0_seq3:18-1325(+)
MGAGASKHNHKNSNDARPQNNSNSTENNYDLQAPLQLQQQLQQAAQEVQEPLYEELPETSANHAVDLNRDQVYGDLPPRAANGQWHLESQGWSTELPLDSPPEYTSVPAPQDYNCQYSEEEALAFALSQSLRETEKKPYNNYKSDLNHQFEEKRNPEEELENGILEKSMESFIADERARSIREQEDFQRAIALSELTSDNSLAWSKSKVAAWRKKHNVTSSAVDVTDDSKHKMEGQQASVGLRMVSTEENKERNNSNTELTPSSDVGAHALDTQETESKLEKRTCASREWCPENDSEEAPIANLDVITHNTTTKKGAEQKALPNTTQEYEKNNYGKTNIAPNSDDGAYRLSSQDVQTVLDKEIRNIRIGQELAILSEEIQRNTSESGKKGKQEVHATLLPIEYGENVSSSRQVIVVQPATNAPPHVHIKAKGRKP